MAEWGDVAWEQATPEYRKAQFVALCKTMVEREEHKAALLALATDDTAIAEELYDAMDDAITEAEDAEEETEE